MTTREFFEADANNIIDDLWQYWSIQRDSDGTKYIRTPFESKEDFLDRYENGLDDPWEELTDIDELTDAEINTMIQEQKNLIAEAYDKVLAIREQFSREYNII